MLRVRYIKDITKHVNFHRFGIYIFTVFTTNFDCLISQNIYLINLNFLKKSPISFWHHSILSTHLLILKLLDWKLIGRFELSNHWSRFSNHRSRFEGSFLHDVGQTFIVSEEINSILFTAIISLMSILSSSKSCFLKSWKTLIHNQAFIIRLWRPPF